jgi:hypothetical protein
MEWVKTSNSTSKTITGRSWMKFSTIKIGAKCSKGNKPNSNVDNIMSGLKWASRLRGSRTFPTKMYPNNSF